MGGQGEVCAELTPRICMVDDAMESAAPLYRALDMGLDELHPAAHHQSRPPSVTLFNIIRPADDLVGGRGGVYAELTARICGVDDAMS